MKVRTYSGKETQKIGYILARRNISGLFALKGDLGSGKTTFLKGFAKGLNIKEEVLSPTFVVFKKYKTEKGFFYHFDAYRINEKDLPALHFSQIIEEENSVVAVEWSENIEKALPQERVDVFFRFINKKERELIIKGISARIEKEIRARSSAG